MDTWQSWVQTVNWGCFLIRGFHFHLPRLPENPTTPMWHTRRLSKAQGHTEGPRLPHGVASELQLPAYTTVTATWDLSHTWDLHHSSWQHCILNPLNWARDRILILMDTSRVGYCWTTMGMLALFIYLFIYLFWLIVLNLPQIISFSFSI